MPLKVCSVNICSYSTSKLPDFNIDINVLFMDVSVELIAIYPVFSAILQGFGLMAQQGPKGVIEESEETNGKGFLKVSVGSERKE